MSVGPRRARVSALAKINLGLKVLHGRADGFHEIRTVFQTISLADEIDVSFTPARAVSIELESTVEIPDNLVERAARLAMQVMRIRGRVEMKLRKRIPMGAGLGGGSSDAAAVLLALPVLAGRKLPLAKLLEMGAQLGSDVPFFLLGGRAVALGRGEELYPLPDLPYAAALVAAPDIHVSTPEAYRALARPVAAGLTPAAVQNIISYFQSFVWSQGEGPLGHSTDNDFESVVFVKHPQLKRLKQRLRALGARAAALSGSGAALFGLFGSRREAEAAGRVLDVAVFPVSLVGRARYRALWWRRLGSHLAGRVWPPQSRYVS